MSPHGVFHAAEIGRELVGRGGERLQQRRGRRGGDEILGGPPPPPPRRPVLTRRVTSSPQKTASDVATEFAPQR